MKSLTVLHLTTFSADFLGSFGESLVNLGKVIKNEGGNLIVCFPERKEWARSFEKEGIGVEIVPIRKTIDFRAIRLICKVIKKYEVSFIHTHFGIETQVSACIIKLFFRKLKVVWHWRNPIRTELEGIRKSKIKVGAGNLAYRFLDKHFIDLHIVISSSLRDMLLRRKLTTADKIKLISNGINVEESGVSGRDIRMELGISKDVPLIGNISNFRPQKDHLTFLESAKIVLEKHPGVKFILVGDGSTKGKVEAYSDKLGISNSLVFTGVQKEVRPFIRACDFTVLSSFYEGFGNVICESMLLERPVIATAVGGITDIVKDGENGLLVPLKNPAMMAEKIIGLIDKPEEVRRLGINGRKLVEARFTTSIWIKSIIKEYEGLLK